MSMNFSLLILYLALYGFMGWVSEVIFCFIGTRKFTNRGFLYGPYCPIYGVGTVFILLLTQNIHTPAAVFLISLCAATALEYFTSWFMEVLFQIRWWDYSKQRFNLNGRICLKNSVLFGLGGLAAVYLMHPIASDMVGRLDSVRVHVLASGILAVFIIDLSFTLNSLLGLTEHLKAVQAELDRSLRERGAQLQERGAQLRAELQENLAQKNHRLLRSFPQLHPVGFDATLAELRERVEKRANKSGREVRARRTLGERIRAAISALHTSLAPGWNLYQLFWVFLSASVLGYVVETLFCIATRGVIESRQGLLYGPFSQVYGFGAVLCVLLLAPLAKKNDRWLFTGSALLGGLFEYTCSYIQENVFHSVSWQYTDKHFSIGGRTCLSYMLFWGILGVVFMKGVYPPMLRLINRISKRQSLFFTWVLIAALAADMLLSATAVYRWSERLQNVPPANAYEQFLDRHYPNGFMEEIYPNMQMTAQR